MLLEATGKPICYRWPGGEVVLTPGRPMELPEDRAWRLLERAPGRVRVINTLPTINDIQAGCWVEWLSPALPQQRGEVLAVNPDGTFEVFHPLTETLCRLPVKWVMKISEGPIVSH
jgi:hypothetical protein